MRILPLIVMLVLLSHAGLASAQVVRDPVPEPTTLRNLEAPADQGEPLIVGGVSLLLGTYLADTLVTAVVSSELEYFLYSLVPVAGPWIQLGATPGVTTEAAVMLVISGLAQATGVALIIAGAVLSAEHEEPTEPEREWSVALAPTGGGAILQARLTL